MKIHHLGIAVRSLSEATALFEKLLGRAMESEELVEDQKVKVALFPLGECGVELLEATSPESAIGKYLLRRGPGIHHVAFTVPELEQVLGRLRQAGVRLIDKTPRVGAGGKKIAFLHPQSFAGTLIELVEEK